MIIMIKVKQVVVIKKKRETCIKSKGNRKNQAQVEKGLSQLKSSGAFYTKDLQFMDKVNPIAFKRERDKQLFEEKVMEKKKRNKLIYEKIKIKPS